jgi:hypothetical protein
MSSLVNVDVGGIVEDIASAADELFTSDEERLAFKDKIEERLHNRLVIQADINKEEAKHSSIFVAGWRPFIGWVCGIGLAMQFILRPVVMYLNQLVSIILGNPMMPHPPALDMSELIPLVLGMLGLAGYRSYEKKNQVPDSLVRFLTK